MAAHCLAIRLTEVCVPLTADRLYYYGVGALHTPSHPFAPVG